MLIDDWRQVRASALVLAMLLAVPAAQGADDKKQFGVRGAGLMSCQMYERAREERSEIYLVAAAWMDGYVTSTNMHADDTYDALPFETTELLAAVIGEHCKKNPNDRLFPVLKNLLEKLHDDRLRSASDKTEIVVGERKVSVYTEVLTRIQQRLSKAGFYQGKIDGDYGAATISAMKAFQRSVNFKPSGFPDQVTLWRLLRDAD